MYKTSYQWEGQYSIFPIGCKRTKSHVGEGGHMHAQSAAHIYREKSSSGMMQLSPLQIEKYAFPFRRWRTRWGACSSTRERTASQPAGSSWRKPSTQSSSTGLRRFKLFPFTSVLSRGCGSALEWKAGSGSGSGSALKLWRLTLEPWRALDAHNGGVEVLWTRGRWFALLWWGVGSGSGSALMWKNWSGFGSALKLKAGSGSVSRIKWCRSATLILYLTAFLFQFCLFSFSNPFSGLLLTILLL